MSAPAPIFSGTIKSCRLALDDPRRFGMYLAGLEGKRIELTVRKFRKSRSNNQNSYLWGVVYKLISEYTGDDDESTHEMCKAMFLAVKRPNLPDTYRSTAGLSTVEFEEYVAKIQKWASEFLFVYIPSPNEVEFENCDFIQ
jgi:hypothetical protein